mgnify:CR=1 FL=1
MQNVVGLTDTAFLGRVGVVELGACGLGVLWYFAFSLVSSGLSTGVQIMTANRVGRTETKSVGRVVDHAMILGLAVGLALLVWFRWITPLIFERIIVSEAVRAGAIDFIRIRGLDAFFIFGIMILRGFFNGVERNRIIMVSTFVLAATNVILNYGLIFGRLGMPKMGLEGAAWASVIAQITGFFVLFFYVYYRGLHREYRVFRLHFFRPRDYRKSVFRELIKISTPVGIQHIFSVLSFFLFIKLIETRGELALAASEVAKNLYIMFMITTWGFATAAGTFVGNLMGQNRPQDVWPTIRRVTWTSMAVGCSISLLLVVFPEAFLRVYTHDASVVAVAKPLCYLFASALALYSFGGVFLYSVIATGAAKVGMYIEITIIALYCAYMVVAHAMAVSLPVFWITEPIYFGTMALLAWAYLRSRKWERYLTPKPA